MRARLSALVLVACATLFLASAASAQAPTLSHSAPKLGNDLVLTLEGAPPGALVRLYSSSEAGSLATPYGTLELERAHLVPLAAGLADPAGRFVHVQPLPLDPRLAELWSHYQALVEDPVAPAGWTLSQAVHLRYVGTRLYELGFGGDGTSYTDSELRVVSGIDLSTLGVIDLDDAAPGPSRDEPRLHGRYEPVFSADLSRGAIFRWNDAPEVLVFDNVRFVPLASIALAPCRSSNASPSLLADPDGRNVVVLEPEAARLTWIDLFDAKITDTLDLPQPVEPVWGTSEDGSVAWLGEHSDTSPRLALRRVDLANRQVLEQVPIGDERGGSLTFVRCAGSLVFACSDIWPMTAWHTLGALSTVDLSTTPASVEVLEWVDFRTNAWPIPLADSVILSLWWTLDYSQPILYFSRLSAQPSFTIMPAPPTWWDIVIRDVIPDGNSFWLLDDANGSHGNGGHLMHWSFDTCSWTQDFQGWGPAGPERMALVRDGLVQRVFLAVDGEPYWNPPVGPTVARLELSTGTWSSAPGSWRPISLHAITVP